MVRQCADLVSLSDVWLYYWVDPESVGTIFVFNCVEKVGGSSDREKFLF